MEKAEIIKRNQDITQWKNESLMPGQAEYNTGWDSLMRAVLDIMDAGFDFQYDYFAEKEMHQVMIWPEPGRAKDPLVWVRTGAFFKSYYVAVSDFCSIMNRKKEEAKQE